MVSKTGYTLNGVSILLRLIIVTSVLMTACDRQDMKPVDDFYRFEKLKWLTLEKPLKTNYILGFDARPFELSVMAYEADGDSIPNAERAIRYFSNAQPLENGRFVPAKAGQFKLYGKLAGHTSDTLTVNVWDPANLSLKLTQTNQYDDFFYADGKDTVSFKVEVWGNGQALPVAFAYDLTANGVSFSEFFSTTTAGAYRFVANALGLKSNEVIITALPKPEYDIVRLPVVFHEISTSDLTAAYIQQLTDGMTKAFRNRYNASGGPKDVNARDFYVEFYPAKIAVDGSILSVPGLDRANGSQKTFTESEAFFEAYNTFWDPKFYVNVWVFQVTGEYANSSWAYMPYVTQPFDGFDIRQKGTEPFLPFGIFLNHSHLKRNDIGGRTEEIISHEMGHILGLHHVFDGNGYDHNDCGNDPDFCADTPFYDRNIYLSNLEGELRNAPFSRKSCSDENYFATNFMDYYFSYNNSFTADQFKRVRHTIDFGLWLPTPSNGYRNATVASVRMMRRPNNLKHIKPVICR